MARKKRQKDPKDPGRQVRIAARREIDEALVRHWPGLSEKEDDGWLMRFSGAYTRWANAVFPLEVGKHPHDAKVPVVEKLYLKHKQRPIFRLTLYTQPETLDQHLADHGYARVGRTSVLTFDLTNPKGRHDPGAGELKIDADLDAGWFDDTNRWLGYNGDGVPPTRARVLKNFLYETHYVSYVFDGEPVAAGVYVVDTGREQGIVTNLTIAPDHDHHGHRTALVRHLIPHARAAGLHRLIVEADMEKGDLHDQLTTHLGLDERYRYWYRAKMFF